jgi:hypothetical protein
MMITYLRELKRRILSKDAVRRWRLMLKQYSFLPTFKSVRPVVLYALDNRWESCGLADRLRGMLSAYAYAKANGLPFQIDHQFPFQLSDYLAPNAVDWTFQAGEKSYSVCKASPVVIMNLSKGEVVDSLKKTKQYHFYTNVNFIPRINHLYGTDYTAGQLFNELFKPSPTLQKAVLEVQTQLGQNYRSVSFRFIGLLGDFQDCGDSHPLPEEEQNGLVARCRQCVLDLVNDLADGQQLLVTADSPRFLEAVSAIPKVYVIPGKVEHIGIHPSEESFLKTFLDFYMVSRAERVYLGLTGKMYKSNFSRMAALCNDRSFEILNF